MPSGSPVATSPPAGPEDSLPPGGGRFPLPHYQTFGAIVNSVSRTYRWTFDEALRHDRENALAIRRDPVVMDALRSRQIPTAQLPWHIEAEDDQDTRQAEAAEEVTKIIEGIPRLQQLKMHLLEAVWWGRYGVQLAYKWDFSRGKKSLKVVDHRPINGDKLIFKYDGRSGVLVHPAYAGSYEATDRGRAHFFTPNERRVVIIHRHEPEDADFLEPDLGGAIQGVGIRSRIYWFWWLRSQVQAWMMDFLERVGAGGFTVYFYEAGNAASLAEVKAAAEEQHKNNTILFPRYRDGSTGGPGIQRVEPSQAGSQLLQALISTYFDNVIRRYILGQNLTSETAGTGLGSGVADLHADTFARLVKYDAINLAETLTTDLVWPIYEILYPGIPKGRFQFDVDKPNAADVLEAAQVFWNLGGTIDEDELRSVIGLARPQAGHAVLAKMGAMQPAGLGGIPQGMPMVGQPGMGGPMPGDGLGGNDLTPGPVPMSRRKRKDLRRYSRDSLNTDPRLLDMARAYAAQHGLPDPSLNEYHPVYEPLSRRIADYYQNAPHAPHDPAVAAAYRAMTEDTRRQFDWAKQHGIKFEPWTKHGQPYRDSHEMRDDAKGGHLFYFLGGDLPADNHLAQDSGVEINGHRHTYNDVFRAVHDLYGHAVHGNQFGPRGEEHAWRTHARMFRPQALPAMSMETRGQNSWVNYGPHLRRADGSIPHKGEQDWIHPAQRPYAPQKNNVLPQELMV